MDIELVVETKVNVTEQPERIEAILHRFIEGEVKKDLRFDGEYFYIRSSSDSSIEYLMEWIRDLYLLDTVRRRLLRNQEGSLTSLYFNKQAAAMGRMSLVDFEDNPPLGPILLQIICSSSEELERAIDKITPKTVNGKEVINS